VTRPAPRRRILITGASAGLGLGMARVFAGMGRDLALCARRIDRLQDVRRDLLATGASGMLSVARLDVTDEQSVFDVFRGFREEFGSLDRVVVNAGFGGAGSPVGSGDYAANRQVALTDFAAVVTQCEAAMEIFRSQGTGHLVVVSSMSALRGFPGSLTVYAASKAGARTLAEGIRADALGTDIRVTTLLPGYIRSESRAHPAGARLVTDTDRGCQLLVRAIEREPAQACVPGWPWSVLGIGLRTLPLRVTARSGGAADRARSGGVHSSV
jgi:hypothetical protein